MEGRQPLRAVGLLSLGYGPIVEETVLYDREEKPMKRPKRRTVGKIRPRLTAPRFSFMCSTFVVPGMGNNEGLAGGGGTAPGAEEPEAAVAADEVVEEAVGVAAGTPLSYPA